jgi:hypothetical protein
VEVCFAFRSLNADEGTEVGGLSALAIIASIGPCLQRVRIVRIYRHEAAKTTQLLHFVNVENCELCGGGIM